MKNEINKLIQDLTSEQRGSISDGYHTFDDLYMCRMALTAALFNILPSEMKAHKSKRHNDGEICFGGGWFIVCAQLPSGQISFHYEIRHWDRFKIPETETALFPYDGHDTNDVIDRLLF